MQSVVVRFPGRMVITRDKDSTQGIIQSTNNNDAFLYRRASLIAHQNGCRSFRPGVGAGGLAHKPKAETAKEREQVRHHHHQQELPVYGHCTLLVFRMVLPIRVLDRTVLEVPDVVSQRISEAHQCQLTQHARDQHDDEEDGAEGELEGEEDAVVAARVLLFACGNCAHEGAVSLLAVAGTSSGRGAKGDVAISREVLTIPIICKGDIPVCVGVSVVSVHDSSEANIMLALVWTQTLRFSRPQ